MYEGVAENIFEANGSELRLERGTGGRITL